METQIATRNASLLKTVFFQKLTHPAQETSCVAR